MFVDISTVCMWVYSFCLARSQNRLMLRVDDDYESISIFLIRLVGCMVYYNNYLLYYWKQNF